MEKKRMYEPEGRKIGLWKIFLVMRLMMFLMLCFVVGSHANVLSQYKLNIKLGQTTYKQLFEEIRRQTGCIVMYNDNMLNKHEQVKADFKDESLDKVLDAVLHDKGLTYEKDAEFIIIKAAALPQSESRTVTGKVKDVQGNPLPGVSVFIKGTTLGIATDADGVYKLTVPEQKDIVLIFSFVGMKSQEVPLKNQKEVNVTLEEDAKVMDEVVVTGIFERKKEGFTGSATTVTGEELKRMTSNNVLRALSMIDPGFRMNVSNVAGSNPNALPDFEMRGQANMGNYDGEDVVIMRGDIDTRPNQPLFVLDGIIGVSISTIIDLDPDRIESITILKDAAAMVVYGSRASNGVVVVETKAPEKGKLRFTYAGNYKYQTPDLSVYHLLNAKDKLELERLAGYYDERYTASNASSVANFYLAKYLDVQRGVNTDWLAQPVESAFNHRHSFTLEGGDNTLRYKLYFGLNQAPGIMKGTGTDAKSGSIDIRYRTNKLLISNQLSIDYTVGDRVSPYGAFREYTLLNPYYRIYDENGAILKVLDNHVYTTDDGRNHFIGNYGTPTMNPMYNIQFNQKNQSKSFEIRNSFRAEYTPWENLRLAADVTLTKSYEDLEIFKPSDHTDFSSYSVENRGKYDWTHRKGNNYNVSLTASYNKVVNADHLVSLFARYDIDNRSSHNASVSVKGFPNDKMDEVFLGATPTDTKGDEGTTRAIGFVGTANYSYKQRYAVDVSVRVDASSEFGKNNRFAPFWSAGLRWNLDKENFIQGLGFMDELVLRGTYGVTGSQGFSPYQSLQMYTYDKMMKLYHSSDVAGTVLQSIGNPDLKWQKTENWNLGLDFNFWKGFVSGRVEYYKKYTKNTLLAFTLAPSVGFNTITDNMGDINNNGYELTLRLMPFNNVKKQMNFSIVLNGSHNDNKIVRISNALKAKNEEAAGKVKSRPLPRYEEGYSQTIIWGVRSLGIDPISGKEIFLTRQNERTYEWNTIDQVPLGDTEPKLQGTVSANFNWKGLSVSLIGGYKFGGQMYNYTLIEKVENANLRLNVDERAFTQRWKQPGDKTFFKGLTQDANGQQTKASSRFVMDENEFTLSTINVQYRFEKRYHPFLSKVGLSSASVSMYMEDLLRLTTVKMERGIDYPFSRQVSMSLNLVF